MPKKYDVNKNKHHPIFNLGSISELINSNEESEPLLRKSRHSPYNALDNNSLASTPNLSKQYTVPETSRILLVRNPSKPIRISHISHLESILNSSSSQGPYYWLYIFQPISFEIELISQMLDLHPLTLEDLITQDPVEKCEEFQNYYVTSFKLIELDLNSGTSIDGPIDLRRNIPDPQYTFVYNIIHPNCIVTFDYGNHPIQDSVLSLLQKPDYQKKIVPDWVGGVMLHSFVEHLDAQLKFLEQEIIAVNDFYLISEDFEGATRHFSPKEGENQLPPRLTQLRKISSDFVEILEIKPNLFNNLLKIFGRTPHSTPSRPSSFYLSKTPSQIGTPVRSSSPVRSLYESTRSLSPVPSFTDISGASAIQKLHAESLEKGLSHSLNRSNLLDSTDIEIWINSSCTQIVGMLREAKLLQAILEKSFELQKTNWDFEMTYSATAFNDKLAFFSTLAWAILPFSLGSLLMGMNVIVPGMSLPHLDGFVNTLGTMTLATLFLLYIARQLELV